MSDDETLAWWAVAIVLALGCAALLSGCLSWRGPHHAAAGDELIAAGAAVEAWEAAGRGSVDACALLDRIEIVDVSQPSEGRSPCVTIADGDRAYGAACMRRVQPSLFGSQRLAIYLDDSLDAQGRLNGIAHETLHYVRACVEGAEDHAHADAELWGAIQTAALSRITN